MHLHTILEDTVTHFISSRASRVGQIIHYINSIEIHEVVSTPWILTLRYEDVF